MTPIRRSAADSQQNLGTRNLSRFTRSGETLMTPIRRSAADSQQNLGTRNLS
jgi:hypothetical protein